MKFDHSVKKIKINSIIWKKAIRIGLSADCFYLLITYGKQQLK